MKMWNKSNNLLIFIFILVAIEGFLFLSGNYQINEKQQLEEERLAKIGQTFANVPVLAKTFSIYDETLKKEIYNKNGNEILPLASLTKIMTVIHALEIYKIDDSVIVSTQSLGENANADTAYGEKWKVGDLAKFTLISSSNDGALALTNNDKNFLSAMNKKVLSLGMRDTTFFNFTGLDLSTTKAGAYGTARDANLMAIYAMDNYPYVFRATVLPNVIFQSESGQVHKVINTNTIIYKIPNLLFSKTGFTTLAGGNLSVIFRVQSGDIIAITLLGSTKDGRFTDMEKLVETAYTLDYGNVN